MLRSASNSKAFFLRCYSLYLAGEKRKEEERIELAGPLGKSETSNKVSVSTSSSCTARIDCRTRPQLSFVAGFGKQEDGLLPAEG